MDPITPAPSDKPAENQVTPSPSLEDISKEFTVEEQANKFSAKPAQPKPQPTQQTQVYVPDPLLDSEGYKAYAAQQVQYTQRLEGSLRELSSRFAAYEQTIQQQKLDADVDSAVNVVNKKWNVDKDLAEITLEREYRKDKTFQFIWDNRHRNPVAFQKALDVIASKKADLFSVKQDPQLAENVRAAKSAQQTMATTKQANSNDEWANLSPREFAEQWERKKRGY
jgi:hypothetical protein